MSHNDKIKDMDAFFEVNPITRQIVNKTPAKIVLMQGDHNSERFTFSLPRYIEGHDMAESAKANLHYINASKNVKGMYEMKDLKVDPDNPDNVICSWLISGNATKEAGKLAFLIEFECYEGDVLVYSWHTLPHEGISVGETFDNAEDIAEMYADVLQQWHDDLFSASAEGVQNIETAKADALESIEAEKENAKTEVEATRGSVLDAIDSKGKETLETIPDDYKALNAKVDETKAESEKTRIVNKSNGTLLTLPDSAEQPFKSMKVFGKTKQVSTTGKNLLPRSYEECNVTSRYGVAITINNDGSILLNGTSTSSQVTNLYLYFDKTLTLPAGDYKIGGIASPDCYIVVYDPTISDYRTTKNNKVISLTLTEETQVKVLIQWTANAVIKNALVKPFIVKAEEYDGVWEPYTGGMPSPNPSYPQALESVGDDGSVEQVVMGKNLIDISQYVKTSSANTVLDKDRLTVTGYLTYVDVYGLEAGKKYTYSWKAVKSSEYGGGFALERFYTDGTRALIVSGAEHLPERSPYTFTMAENVEFLRFYFYGGKQNINDNPTTATYYYVQLEGETATPYEPYKSQSFTIPTPNGLPGVPVSSGGNYTDENGQQWICDEVDFERGVLVQRVWKQTFNGSEKWQSNKNYYNDVSTCFYLSKNNLEKSKAEGMDNIICDHFMTEPNIAGIWTNTYTKQAICGYSQSLYYDCFVRISLSVIGSTNNDVTTNVSLFKTWLSTNPVNVMYKLAEPIETPLSEEEIEAYKALHTNYPVTTIYNNDGAGTEVEYVADTKNYIDNKFAELQSAIISTGGNV